MTKRLKNIHTYISKHYDLTMKFLNVDSKSCQGPFNIGNKNFILLFVRFLLILSDIFLRKSISIFKKPNGIRL